MKDSQKNPQSYFSLSKRTTVVILLVFAYLAAGLTLHFVVPAFTWHWFIFGLIAVVIPAGLICFYDNANKSVAPTSDQKKQASKFFIKYTVFYWFADCLYMAIFNGWTPWIFALGILFIVLVWINLANAFLSNNKRNIVSNLNNDKRNTASNLNNNKRTEVNLNSNFFVVLDLVVGLAATVYLIYIIPQELLNLQTIVTTIVAAVYGGILTLVGVAWTIRHSTEERKLMEKKREAERKEEERKKYKPYFNHSFPEKFDFPNSNDNTVCVILIGKGQKVKNKILTYVCNSNNSIFKIDGISLNGEFYPSKATNLILEGQKIAICCYVYKDIDLNQAVARLYVSDILGNQYIYNITFLLLSDTKGKTFFGVKEIKELSGDEYDGSF